MAGEMSTAGATLQYAVEATQGVRPTTGYKIIPGCTSTPDFNPAPETLDVTDLSDEEYRRYIPALKSVGESMAFGFNLSTSMRTAWGNLVTTFETAFAAEKSVWFAVVHTRDPEAYYFNGEPVKLGMGAMNVGEVRVMDAYIVPNKIEGWAVKPTTTP